MIPRLYAAGTTVFTNDGLGALAECISVEASNSINGVPELNLTYPTTGTHADEIGERCVIVAKPNMHKSAQPYIVKTVDKSTPGIMQVYAIHLCVDLADGVGLKPFTATSLGNAINALSTYATSALPIAVTTMLSSSTDFNHSKPSTLKLAMGGMEGSFLDTYGGEWDFNGLTATLKNASGYSNVLIRYGKNLESLQLETDWSGVYTGIYPFWQNSQTGAVKQMTSPVYSLGTFTFEHVLVLDVTSSFKEEPTDAQLLSAAQAYAGSHTLTSPSVSWNVVMRDIRKASGYEQLALLEEVGLGDTVTIYYPDFDVNATARIVSERFDVLREIYNELQIGRVRSSLAGSIVAREKETDADISATQSVLGDAIDRATALITGNTGGYIYTKLNASGEPEAILIMDDPDINNATKVWQWNLGGLGHSSTGTNGPYTTAITQDGEIVADFIKTGTLDASLISVINLIAEHVRAVDGTKTMDISAAELEVNNGTNWRAWLHTDSNDQGALILYGGKRTNLNGQATDAGNDSTSAMSYIDPHGIAVGLDNTDTATGSIRASGLRLQNNGYVYLYDSNGKLRIWGDGSDGSLLNQDASGNYRWWLDSDGSLYLRDSTPRVRAKILSASGNLQLYGSNGQERVGLYPAEGQLALYNSSGTKIVEIRADGTASSYPLPINQGGSGVTGAVNPNASVTSSTGKITLTTCRVWGRVVMVNLTCSNSSATSAMNIVAQGTLSDVPLPKETICAVNYNANHMSITSIAEDGSITCRVMVGSLTANNARKFCFTYISW